MFDLFKKSKYPIIVVEGPDGAGKTSLAECLQDQLAAKYVHLTYRFKDRMHLYHTAAISLVARYAQHQPVILDRWWISEIIYAEVYRGGSPFIKHYFILEHVAKLLGLTYVICLPEDKARYVDHFNELKNDREEMFSEGMERVYDGYHDLYRNYLGVRENVLRYDMFKHWAEDETSREMTLSNVCQRVLEFTEDYRSGL